MYPYSFIEYLFDILFSDECIFRINGVIDKQNVKRWELVVQKSKTSYFFSSEGAIKWLAISKELMICPLSDYESVMGENY